MKTLLSLILGGVVFVIGGALVVDLTACHATGAALIGLGLVGMFFGPLFANELEDGK